MRINDIAREIHENAVEHGWWETERPFGEIIALCHSELSEALEAYRDDEPLFRLRKIKGFEMIKSKPDGIAVEMIDCIIRILDYLAKEGVDIERLLIAKHEYNKTRPYKHGGKKI